MRYENTYQPAPSKRFEPKVAVQVLEELLAKNLTPDRTYVSLIANRVPEAVSEEAVTALKKLVDKRYRLVCSVFVCQIQPGEGAVESITRGGIKKARTVLVHVNRRVKLLSL